jgi:hypothetical protein
MLCRNCWACSTNIERDPIISVLLWVENRKKYADYSCQGQNYSTKDNFRPKLQYQGQFWSKLQCLGHFSSARKSSHPSLNPSSFLAYNEFNFSFLSLGSSFITMHHRTFLITLYTREDDGFNSSHPSFFFHRLQRIQLFNSFPRIQLHYDVSL